MISELVALRVQMWQWEANQSAEPYVTLNLSQEEPEFAVAMLLPGEGFYLARRFNRPTPLTGAKWAE